MAKENSYGEKLKHPYELDKLILATNDKILAKYLSGDKNNG